MSEQPFGSRRGAAMRIRCPRFGHVCLIYRRIVVIKCMEAPSGFEPLHRGFADLSLSHLGTAPILKAVCAIVCDNGRPRKHCAQHKIPMLQNVARNWASPADCRLYPYGQKIEFRSGREFRVCHPLPKLLLHL
jgi:hypothetical protein